MRPFNQLINMRADVFLVKTRRIHNSHCSGKKNYDDPSVGAFVNMKKKPSVSMIRKVNGPCRTFVATTAAAAKKNKKLILSLLLVLHRISKPFVFAIPLCGVARRGLERVGGLLRRQRRLHQTGVTSQNAASFKA